MVIGASFQVGSESRQVFIKPKSRARSVTCLYNASRKLNQAAFVAGYATNNSHNFFGCGDGPDVRKSDPAAYPLDNEALDNASFKTIRGLLSAMY